jgi:CubicO group peptidase (beta-lactamase class C family)
VRGRVLAAAVLVLAAATAVLTLGREGPEDVLDELVRVNDAPGGVIAWARPGEAPQVHAVGLADRATGVALDPSDRMRIASLSKPVTAGLILRLVDEGRFSLDTPIADLVTGAGPALPDTVTVAQALAHTGGWDRTAEGDPYFLPASEIAARYGVGTVTGCRDVAAAIAPTVAPGTRYLYSNIGYCWLGEIVSALDGGYLAAVQDAFGAEFRLSEADIGVRHDTTDTEAAFVVMEPAIAGPFGGLVTDARSYLEFARRPVDPRVLAEPTFDWEESYYGLGWRVWKRDGTVYLTHYGSMPGTFSFVIRSEGGGAAVVLLNGGVVQHEATARALALLFMRMDDWQ